MTSNCGPVTLVVGADSLVGSALQAQLLRVGKPVLGTTRRLQAVDGSRIFLDLSQDMGNWECPRPNSAAILCAGVTKYSDCIRDPEMSARVNVHGISALAEKLVDGGAQVVHLSTSAVFDGSVAHRPQDDPVCPTTEYGRQNAEAERRILALGNSAAVVRFSKILGPNLPLFRGWVQVLRDGYPIHPYSDMVMAPLHVSFAVSVLIGIAEARLHGIFQTSGDRDVSYADAALLFASWLGADADLVQPIESSKEKCHIEPLNRHTTLDGSRLMSSLGIEPPVVPKVLRAYFAEVAGSAPQFGIVQS